MGGFWDFFRKRAKSAADPGSASQEVSETTRKAQITRLENQLRRFSLERKYKKLQRLKDLQEERALDEDISDIEDDLYNDEDESGANAAGLMANPEALLTQLFLTKLAGQKQAGAVMHPNNSTPASAPPAPGAQETKGGQDLTDAQIQAEVDKIPDPVLLELLNYEDNQIKEVIRKKYPGLSAQTYERAVEIIRQEGV